MRQGTQKQKVIKLIEERGSFTAKEAAAEGIYGITLTRMLAKDEIARLGGEDGGRAFYTTPAREYDFSLKIALEGESVRHVGGVFVLKTAAWLHGLTNERTHGELQIAVPRQRGQSYPRPRAKSDYRYRLHTWSEDRLIEGLGIEEDTVGGRTYLVTTPARTTVDVWRCCQDDPALVEEVVMSAAMRGDLDDEILAEADMIGVRDAFEKYFVSCKDRPYLGVK